MENHKRYQIKKAQLIIADIPYNLGNLAYASNPNWYVGGDNTNGESESRWKTIFLILTKILILIIFLDLLNVC